LKEVYRKFGRVIRRENAYLLRVDEGGKATEEDGRFTATPIAGRDIRNDGESSVVAAAAAIEKIVRPPLMLERMMVSEGVVFHEFGETRWSETNRRIHLSIARPPDRALIDLADFSTGIIARVAAAFALLGGERDRPRRIRLADHVGAAALPSLVGTMALEQWAAPHDGKGQWIENRPVTEGLPPNWFRPSYRARPVRAWFHLRAVANGSLDREAPEAIALLAPIHDRTLRVLCVEGDQVFTTTLWAGAVRAVFPTAAWYPYAAGCFGAEIML
jgi:hypothetical protein